MKKIKPILQILLIYPFIGYLLIGIAEVIGVGFLFEIEILFGLRIWIPIIGLPLFIIAFYKWLGEELNPEIGLKVNGIALLAFTAIFTILMVIGKGNLESHVVLSFAYVLLPCWPLTVIALLMGDIFLTYATAFLTYFAGFLFCAIRLKYKSRRLFAGVISILLCLGISGYYYAIRPSVRYGGHGFNYMNGYSSTDFTDYTVYADNSKLVTLDHEASLLIENEEDMPVLDGAEACYPLYAALAKAVYKDIGQIELAAAADSENELTNGKIVTFTNTLYAFDDLIYAVDENDQRVDIFFGAKPSASQQAAAKEEGIELEITPIGKEAFVFFVEEDNPITGLTSEQIREIYSDEITNWKELGGKNQEIIAFQRPDNSGSQTMMIYFMGDTPLKEPLSYEKISSMDGVIRTVAQYANEDGAMGYTFRYFLEELNQEKGVKMLEIDGIYPTVENIRNGTYPLTVDLCIVTRKDNENPYVQKMIDFILSEDGQEIIEKTGYAPLNQGSAFEH